MLTKEKLEGFFLDLNYGFSTPAEGIWVINADHDDSTVVVITMIENLIVFRLKLSKLPADADLAFYKMLLASNMELAHGAVAIDGEDLVLVDTVEVEGINADELHASVLALEEGAQLIYNKVKK